MTNHFTSPSYSAVDSPARTTMRICASCPDQPGVVAAVSAVIHKLRGNIRESSQFSTDPDDGVFFLRLVVDTPSEMVDLLRARLDRLAAGLDMEYRVWPAERRRRMAVLCSTGDHCVLDLLWRATSEDLPVDVPIVISNHDTLHEAVGNLGVPFHHVPADREDRTRSEQQILHLLASAEVDFVVLARYMQVLTDDFLKRVGVPVINIHHSLLPAFIGSQPYHRAHERGVKVIGATAHYTTADLDAGPIIAQGVAEVGHTDDAATMARRGKNIERTVLARAVHLHIEDRVQVHANRTIIHG